MPEESDIAAPDAAQLAETQAKPVAVPEAATQETEDEQQEQKPKGGFQRKIDKLTRERYELREQLAEIRGRLAAMETRPAGTNGRTETGDPEPKPTDFGTYEEYIKAAARWVARQEHQSLSAKDREREAATEQAEREREIVSSYNERLEEFRADHDDFNYIVGKAMLTQEIAPSVQVALMEDERGPEMAYYLGQHPEVCDHLNSLSAAGAVKYLGRLSERLFPENSAEEETEESGEASEEEPVRARTPAPRAVAQAPAPLKPVKKPAPTATGLADDLSMEEWVKRREAQLRKK